jgi:hypothetical protein
VSDYDQLPPDYSQGQSIDPGPLPAAPGAYNGAGAGSSSADGGIVAPDNNVYTLTAGQPQCVMPSAPQPQSAPPSSAPPPVCEQMQTGPSPDQAPPDQMGPNAGLELLKFGAGFVPGVGQFVGGAQTGTDLAEHHYGSALLDTAETFIPPLGAVGGMLSFFTSDMHDHSLNPDTGLTKDQERWMYQHGAQSVDPNAKVQGE